MMDDKNKIETEGLEKEVREKLDKNPLDTIELSHLSEQTYNHLKGVFENNYSVHGIINISKVDENRKKGGEEYVLHIRKLI